MKILVLRRGRGGAMGGPARSDARMGRAARWRPPALTERLLDFERLDEAWPRGRTAIERVAVWKAAKPG